MGKTTYSSLKILAIASLCMMIRIPLSQILRGVFIFERSDVPADIAWEIRRVRLASRTAACGM
jgi:hypothetical protein